MAYLTTAEITALIELELPSTDERRACWESLSADDKTVVANQAQRDIDGCNWKGKVEDTDAQSAMWPRIDDNGETILPGGELAVPASLGASAWTTLLIPGDIRRGVALQAAARARQAQGYDNTRQMLDAAQAGVTAKSGPSGSVSLGNRARSAWARIDADALMYVMGLARFQGTTV